MTSSASPSYTPVLEFPGASPPRRTFVNIVLDRIVAVHRGDLARMMPVIAKQAVYSLADAAIDQIERGAWRYSNRRATRAASPHGEPWMRNRSERKMS